MVDKVNCRTGSEQGVCVACFIGAKKNEGDLRLPRRRSVGTPLWWTADPPRPFQLCPVPICSALRFLVSGLPPVFIYRRFRVYLKESRIPIESPLMVRPLLLAEPGPGDASCTTWTLTVFIYLLYFQAGRPSGKSAF